LASGSARAPPHHAAPQRHQQHRHAVSPPCAKVRLFLGVEAPFSTTARPKSAPFCMLFTTWTKCGIMVTIPTLFLKGGRRYDAIYPIPWVSQCDAFSSLPA